MGEVRHYKALQTSRWGRRWRESIKRTLADTTPLTFASLKSRLMKRLFPHVCVTLLLAATGAAFADPPSGQSVRPPVEVTPIEPERAVGDEPRDERRPERTDRRQSRLSPEERRALRQQINEAGQDLYPPKRSAP